MAMLTCKLPLIVIVSPCSPYIVNRQIGVEESKYRVTDDPPFTGVLTTEMQNWVKKGQ